MACQGGLAKAESSMMPQGMERANVNSSYLGMSIQTYEVLVVIVVI